MMVVSLPKSQQNLPTACTSLCIVLTSSTPFGIIFWLADLACAIYNRISTCASMEKNPNSKLRKKMLQA